MSKLALLAAIVITTTASITTANDLRGATSVPRGIAIIDGDVVLPSTLSMRTGDVLEFTNYSAEPMLLSFIEPRDTIDRIRCPVAHDEAPSGAPDPLWLDVDGSRPRLSTIIPPGRSASSCSLDPGHYGFLLRRVSRDFRAPDDSLGTKGVITVEP